MAAPTVVAVSGPIFANGSGEATPALPTGWQAGDLLVAWVVARNSTAGDRSVLDEAGWTTLAAAGNGTDMSPAKVFGKIAQVGEVATGFSSDNTDTQPEGAVVVCIRGWVGDVADLVGAVSPDPASTSTNPIAPDVTTTAADSLVLRFSSHGANSSITTDPAGHTQLAHGGTALGSDMALSAWSEIEASAGSAGTASIVMSSSRVWRTASVAIAPVGAGQVVALGQAVETDTARALTVRPLRVPLGQAVEVDTAGTISPPITLSVDFTGDVLPDGWTVYDPVSSGTVSIGNGSVVLTSGAGNVGSIAGTGSQDQSIGVQHDLGGGDLDVAVRIDGTDTGDWGDIYLQSVNLLVFGDTTASALRLSLYLADMDHEGIRFYGYTRTGGVGGDIANVSFNRYFGGVPNWWRVRYTASSGLWEFLHSSDGVTWSPHRDYEGTVALTATRQFEPKTIVIGATNGTGTGVPIRVSRVVDLLTSGTTDLRATVPPLSEQVVSAFDGTAGALPANWVNATLGPGFSTTWTGTALRLAADASVTESPNLSESRAAIKWTGTSYVDCELYVEMSAADDNSSYFYTPQIGADPVNLTDSPNGLDQYSLGGGYGLEVQLATIRRPIRIDDDSDGTSNPTPPHSTGLNETPYAHLKNTTGPNVNTGLRHHFRQRRHRSRYQIKEWVGLRSDEPAEWNVYDGDEYMNAIAFRPALTLSYNNTGGAAAVDVHRLEFIALYTAVPLGGQAVEVDTAGVLTPIRSRTIALAQAVETDTAQTLDVVVTPRVITVPLDQAVEVMEAATLPVRKTVALGQAVEASIVNTLAVRKARALLQATETDVASSLTRRGTLVVPLAQAVETDTAWSIAAVGGSSYRNAGHAPATTDRPVRVATTSPGASRVAATMSVLLAQTATSGPDLAVTRTTNGPVPVPAT